MTLKDFGLDKKLKDDVNYSYSCENFYDDLGELGDMRIRHRQRRLVFFSEFQKERGKHSLV